MKFHIHTLGCKSNQVESSGVAKLLISHGYELTESTYEVNFFIINTCCVTHTSEKKSRQAISKFLKDSPRAKVFIFGCASIRDSRQFQRESVALIWETKDKEKFVEKIMELEPVFKINIKNNIQNNESTKTRSFIKIQDGCDNFCSYCIVPYVRGRAESCDKNTILEEVFNAEKTTQEIILTGINISAFGKDNNSSLTELIRELKQFNIRKRLSSLECVVVDEEFVRVCVESNVCEHFHLSLQSGSDATLKRMNRNYSIEGFSEKVATIRKLMPNVSITTDVIVGFGGETDKEFQETYDICKALKFSDIHIFPFSLRKGTKAEEFPDIHDSLKRERVKILSSLKDQLRGEFLKNNLNTLHEVLVEEKIDEFNVGYSRNYIKIYSNAKTKEISTITPKNLFKDGLSV
ncbi:MAG: MiaB/RimO family radical SAM methylthiotransferase [Firmicutes bacterium]|nr:MiaB/RimO family radical SAM methylthiotransferase [Bacillota bacterium]MCL2256532.1 MiaB/RimO family radical SAM methylthiotransferase [Bacillota bacterium]